MSGETDLAKMLSTLRVDRRPGVFAFTTLERIPDDVMPEASIVEAEGVTLVVPIEIARSRGWEVAFEAAWLTLAVHSALNAVGLTAAFSRALGDAGIPCNVLAGAFHDHILVPVELANAAIDALHGLSSAHS